MARICRFVVFGVMAFCLFGQSRGTALADALPLIAPISGISLLNPDNPSKLPPYSQTGGSLTWSVGPWGSPGGRMPPFSETLHGSTVVYATAAPAVGVSLAISPSGTALSLSQNGAPVPCMQSKRVFEFDLFAAPNGSTVLAPRHSGYLPAAARHFPLTALQALTFGANIEMSEGLATTRKQCQNNFGNLVVAVILDNPKRHQTFFYQLFISTLCGSDPTIKLPACKSSHSMFQFFMKNPYGSDDALPLSGISFLPQNQAVNLKVDLLPRLVRMVQTSKGGADQDISDWTFHSIYVGQIMYGDVTLRSTWKDISLVATTKPGSGN